jgi:hypothetical protein
MTSLCGHHLQAWEVVAKPLSISKMVWVAVSTLHSSNMAIGYGYLIVALNKILQTLCDCVLVLCCVFLMHSSAAAAELSTAWVVSRHHRGM